MTHTRTITVEWRETLPHSELPWEPPNVITIGNDADMPLDMLLTIARQVGRDLRASGMFAQMAVDTH